MRNPEKIAAEMAERKQLILETGFKLFSEKTIEKVTMNDVAKRCGIGIATLYRYYNGKTPLVLDINTLVWKKYLKEKMGIVTDENRDATGAERYAIFVNTFIEMYRNNKDLLRFNQFFNIYMQSEEVDNALVQPLLGMIHMLSNRFHNLYLKGQQDGTLRTDASEQEIFSTTIHIMLAAVTRYAVGLVFMPEGTDAESELTHLKEMLLFRYTRKAA